MTCPYTNLIYGEVTSVNLLSNDSKRCFRTCLRIIINKTIIMFFSIKVIQWVKACRTVIFFYLLTWWWCVVVFLSLRFPEPESPSDDCEEDIRVDGEPGWLPPLSHDLRQLPEAAWLLQHRDHARETVDCGSWGPAVFPPFLISPHLTFKCLLQQLMKSRLPS